MGREACHHGVVEEPGLGTTPHSLGGHMVYPHMRIQYFNINLKQTTKQNFIKETTCQLGQLAVYISTRKEAHSVAYLDLFRSI